MSWNDDDDCDGFDPTSADRAKYRAESERLDSLANFLRFSAFLPLDASGKPSSKLREDYSAACEEALEAIRRIASNS